MPSTENGSSDTKCIVECSEVYTGTHAQSRRPARYNGPSQREEGELDGGGVLR